MAVTFEPTRVAQPPSPGRGGQTPARQGDAAGPRRSRPPRPRVVDVALVLAGLGLGATVGLAITAETSSQLRAPGGVAMYLGNLTGLVGTYLALLMVLLVSRIPTVERVLGQDGLLRWHRRLSPWPISLIVAHAVLLTYAYAEAARTGILHQLAMFISSYSGMLIAIVGFGIFVAVAAISVYSVRRRLRRERWWAMHLGMYLAFSLAFLHEIVLGPSFVGHPLTTAVWSAAWAATAGVVIVFRLGLPLVRSLRHALVVEDVRQEADGVVSIILRGRKLDRLRVSGGQFFEWRFLSRGLFWQAHPYSVSARPKPPYLRLTVKSVGDHSEALARLSKGTRVAIEGPYGAFTSHARHRDRAAFFVGGIGITSVRSLLEDLPRSSQPIVVWRVSTPAEAALEEEVRAIVDRLHGKVHVVSGSRRQVPIHRLVQLVADVKRRDVFVSGSEDFVDAVVRQLSGAGVSREAIHREVYAL